MFLETGLPNPEYCRFRKAFSSGKGRLERVLPEAFSRFVGLAFGKTLPAVLRRLQSSGANAGQEGQGRGLDGVGGAVDGV